MPQYMPGPFPVHLQRFCYAQLYFSTHPRKLGIGKMGGKRVPYADSDQLPGLPS